MLRPDHGFDIGAAERLVADRARAITRLRQRIVPEPSGRRRQMWSEDETFDPSRHVRRVLCPAPGDDRAMLDVAATVLVEPFPKDLPLWRPVLVTGAVGGGVGVVLAVHHCLAEPCSLLAPTGPQRRRFATAGADLASVRAAAHHGDGTVNDALLAAVSGALCALLERRGESVRTLRVAVPVARPRTASPDGVGNAVTALLAGIASGAGPAATVRAIASTLAAALGKATAPSPIVLLWPLFRILAATGLYHRYMTRQRRIHTLVSNVRGPEGVVAPAGTPVELDTLTVPGGR